MITEKALRKYVNQSKPFQIHLADGRAIQVPHGEHVSVQPGGACSSCGSPTADLNYSI
jgi:hypothetical protein